MTCTHQEESIYFNYFPGEGIGGKPIRNRATPPQTPHLPIVSVELITLGNPAPQISIYVCHLVRPPDNAISVKRLHGSD